MKISKHISILSSLSLAFSLGIGLTIAANKPYQEAAAYSTTTLPTTINLNDYTEQEIRSYYSSLNSLSASERQGTNLLEHLKDLLKSGQQYFNYDSGDNVWRIYEIIDRDWEKSPASAISHGTYNSSTNTITNYTYGSNGDNPYLHALYVNRNVNHQTRAWGDHSQKNWGINREHIWAKSQGFQASGQGGARGDPMHLWAANGFVNNKHSNYFFAFVDKNRAYDDCGDDYYYLSNNYKGYSKNAGGNTYVFEPQDCDKGDIARAVFYMVARYNYYSGSDSDGIGTNNPNLRLTNSLSDWKSSGDTSSTTKSFGMGLMSDLLAWNKLDPVDEFEIHRNNLLQRNYTHNRNPFIDFPSWADAIWGTANLDGTGYNPSITTSANPLTDALHSGSSAATFSISTNSVDLTVGDTADIYGMNAEGNITWSIDDGTVVSLNKNSTSNNEKVTITALKNGSATITATNGGNSETCIVSVSDSVINYGSLEHPLTITQAKQIIDNNGGELTEKMYVEGIVSSNSALNTTYNNYEVWLESEDGQTSQAFELYHAYFTDSSLNETYQEANSMQGYKVVAYGHGKKYNSTYELSPDSGNTDKPEILSITPVQPVEKTPQELIEETDTATSLSYRYSANTTEGGVTDILDKEFTGRSGNTYTSWTNDSDSGISYAGQSAADYNSIQLRSNNNNSGIVVTNNPNNTNAASISVTWNTNTANGRTLNIYGKNTAYTNPTNLYATSEQGTLLGTIVYGTSTSLTITGSYKYIGFRSNSGALYLDEVQIQWGSASTTTYDYRDVSIRFGGRLTQELWNDLDTENHVIEGFGVMITTYDFLEGEDIKDFYESASPAEDNSNIDEEIIDYCVPIANMATKMGVDGDNYFWNLRYGITDLTEVYVAAAYIKTSTEYVFFKQATFSVKTLADDYIDNRGYNSQTAEGSLANLTTL